MADPAPPDPYLSWAEANDPAGTAADTTLAVAIECRSSVRDLAKLIDAGSLPEVRLARRYRQDSVLDVAQLRFCTAYVRRSGLARLAQAVLRFKVGLAVPAHARQPADTGTNATSDRVPAMGSRVVIGVIDDFVAYAHPRFRAARGGSRVRHVWSQDELRPDCRNPDAWRPAIDSGYGYELDTAAAHAAGVELAHSYPSRLPRATHGTHVADLAAGFDAPDPALPDIVAVHLPRRGIADTSGGALKVQVLDALHYIVERAGADAKVVVNLSLGTMAGAHDGCSILEQAIDELVQQRNGRLAVVLPAGNAREARCHARLDLDRKTRRATLRWQVMPDDATPSFVELWLGDAARKALTVSLFDPSGRLRLSCRRGELRSDPPGGPARCALIFHDRVADSPQGTMVLVALAPTAARAAHVVTAPPGVWTLQLEHAGDADLGQVHAWIERDDSLRGFPRLGRQSRFVDNAYARPLQRPGTEQDGGASPIRRRGAFNSIANGKCSIVVGGYLGEDGRVALYSGGGPTRNAHRRGPTLLAQSEESATLHGHRAAATRACDTVRMNGTSVAAPLVTRRIAELLAQSGPDGLVFDAVVDALMPRAAPPQRPELEGLGRWPTSAREARAAIPGPVPARAGSRPPPDPSSAG